MNTSEPNEMPPFPAEAEDMAERIVAWRRDFHRHPEIGFQEHRSAEIIAQTLRELDLTVETGIAETGVMGTMQGARSSPVALLRFDMDALPVLEETGASYASTSPGVMHACGHDGHMAIGLTVANLLGRYRERLPGVVKFVFQPAEEGLGGAERMLEEGLLERAAPDFCLALHLWNVRPIGWFGVAAGPTMASSDILEVEIEGQGGHGASPHQTIDPVIASAQLITALQSVVSRDLDPLDAAVVSVTQVSAGDAHNVIPSRATLRGTIRSFKPDVRDQVHRRVEEIAEGVARSMKCRAQVRIRPLTPTVVNDAAIAERLRTLIHDAFPDAHVDSDARTMGSEDMAFFMERVPGCYFFVGSSNPDKGLDAAHHNPKFDFDERALPTAAGLMAQCVWSLLSDA